MGFNRGWKNMTPRISGNIERGASRLMICVDVQISSGRMPVT